MKYIRSSLALLITVALLLTSSFLSGCSSAPEEYDYTLINYMITDYTTEYTYDDVKIQVNSIDLYAAVPYISLTIINEADDIISCDSWYIVEKNIEDQWTSCEIAETDFDTIEKGVYANSSSVVDYYFGEYFEINELGEYRLRTKIYHDPAGDRTETEVAINFTVTNDNLDVKVDKYEFQEEDRFIDLTWRNNTEQNIYLTKTYNLEKKSENEWISCTRKGDEPSSSLYVLQPGEKVEQSYQLSEDFNTEQHGNYRMTVEYFFNTESGTETRKIIIEFKIPYIFSMEY